MPVLGLITCQVLELEFAHILAQDPEVSKITVLRNHFSDGFSQALQEKRGSAPESILYAGEFAAGNFDRIEVLVKVLEVGLHRVIDDLRNGVIRAGREIAPCVDSIMLGYGLCGNALEKPAELLSGAGIPVVVPMDGDHPVDDCIGLLIGGRENYYAEQCRCAGTMFMTAGWAHHWKDIMLKTRRGELDLAMAKRLMANYERVLALSTPVMPEERMAPCVQEFSEVYGLRIEAREGTLHILNETWRTAKRMLIEESNARVS
jgi:hypothetical protein